MKSLHPKTYGSHDFFSPRHTDPRRCRVSSSHLIKTTFFSWIFRIMKIYIYIPRNSNSQKKLGVCENWVFTCRFRCFRRFSQKLVVFWGLHSLAYTDQLEVTQRLYGRFLPLIMDFCEQILGLWGKTEPCRDLLFHTSMAKEVGMWPSEFTQHE